MFEISQNVFNWLMDGDPAIRWQVMRDLASYSKQDIEREREKIAYQGWGKQLLDLQDPEGTWAQGFYNPKWISTHYTLLLLKKLGISQTNEQCKKGPLILLKRGFVQEDGGINFSKAKKSASETCITGMVFGLLSYFQIEDSRLIDIFHYQMEDGGWNCQFNKGAHQASVHTTMLVLEGLQDFKINNPANSEITDELIERGVEFLLQHKLFKSHTTGEVIHQNMTTLSFPTWWRYKIITALDYLREIKYSFDERIEDAIDLLKSKEKSGKWPVHDKITGKMWFELEKTGQPSRMNTLKALRILKWWNSVTI